MAVYSPAYRLRLYAPRSVDSTEATVLTPQASAPHADAFQVCSRAGLTGYQPYLGEVRGRRGAIDPLSKKTDAGQLTVTLLDKRTGTSNASRWVTGFAGDAAGVNLFVGRKVVIEESLDYVEATGVGTWTAFFTGRVTNARLRGKLAFELELRDRADDLDVDIFVGQPHTSASSYAFMSPVAPIGLPQAFANFPVTEGLAGTVTGTATDPTTGVKAFKITIDKTNGDTSRAIITKALQDLNYQVLMRGDPYEIKAYVYCQVGGVDKRYNCDWVSAQSTAIDYVYLRELVGGDAAPALTTAVTAIKIVPKDYKPTATVPLLISDVHPVTLWKAILDGYFGPLTSTGAPRWTVPYDSTAFATLIADTSIPKMRFIITDTAKMNAWIEENICKPLHLAYYLDGQGRVVPVDLRRAATTASTGTLTNADLLDGREVVGWVHSGEAVTSILCTYYLDEYVKNQQLPKPFEPVSPGDGYTPPDIPVTRVVQKADLQLQLLQLGARVADLKGQRLGVDAKGFRFAEGEKVDGKGTRRQAIEGYLQGFQEQIKGPFGIGAAYVTLACARSSTVAVATQPGRYVVLDIDELPDPASNTRGGARLAVCVGRQEDGPAINLLFLDAGPNAVAVVPTVGTPTAASLNDKYRIAAAVTLNASSEYVELHYNATAPGTGSRPADTDAGWTFGARVTATGTAIVDNIPLDSRVWVRARSIGETSGGHKDKLPSAWAYPAGAGYVDVTIGASGISALGASNLKLSVATLAWTNSNTTDEVEVLVVAGAAPAAWLDEYKVASLPAGATSFTVHHLDSNAAHVAAVRLRTASGATSTPVTVSFSTNTTPNVCPTPVGLTVALS